MNKNDHLVVAQAKRRALGLPDDPESYGQPTRAVPTCVVEGCDEPATKEIQVAASAQVFQPLLYVLQEVDMKIGLCDGHHDLLTHDVVGRLSVA